MSAIAPPVRPLVRSGTLRELLLRAPGWHAATAGSSTLPAGEHHYLLSPLAAAPEGVALLCESPPGAPLPDYRERRRIRALLDESFPRHLTLFTDAAHTVRVWSWTHREPGGPLAYREHTYPEGSPDEVCRQALREMGITTDFQPAARAGEEGDPAGPVLRALLAGVRAGRPAAYAALEGRFPPSLPAERMGQAVQDAVEEADDPELLRAFWRALRRSAVLDPACGTGDWLLRALEMLEPVYEACLQRMKSWVEEVGRGRPRVRRDRLSDFRAVLGQAENTRRYATTSQYARESILVRNLYGTDRSPAAVEGARQRLTARVRASVLPDPGCALRVGNPALGFRTAAEVLAALGDDPDAERRWARLAEEAETVERAGRELRRMRLERGATPEELEPGYTALRLRRDSLAAELDLLLARRDGADPAVLDAWRGEGRPLHLLVEFPEVVRAGGFAVVRGAGR